MPMVSPLDARLALLAAALLLGGCADGGPGAEANPLGATAATGILQGVVVDDAVRPVAGARVDVTGDGVALNATTGDDGLFRFTGLQPGTYLVQASKEFYASHQQALVVLAAVDDPELARFQLVFEPSSVPFATMYKYEGFHECGLNAMRVCSNVNIATWIVACANTGVCVGNVTNDRSVFLQPIDGPPTFLQAEMVWTPTSPLGTELGLFLGGGTEEELRSGVSLPAFNFSDGPSPLMVRVSNHEGEGAWCRQVPDPPCGEQALNESGLGVTRALMGQVDAGPTVKHPACGTVSPCGVGWSMQQPFTLYTTVFYGYEPPADWLFSAASSIPPPPA